MEALTERQKQDARRSMANELIGYLEYHEEDTAAALVEDYMERNA